MDITSAVDIRCLTGNTCAGIAEWFCLRPVVPSDAEAYGPGNRLVPGVQSPPAPPLFLFLCG